MKVIVSLLIALSSVSAFASDCSQNEAQFIGKVTELRVVKVDQGIRDCYFKINFSLYNESGVCPLHYSTAASTELLDSDCKMNLENGKEISGILVEENGYLYID